MAHPSPPRHGSHLQRQARAFGLAVCWAGYWLGSAAAGTAWAKGPIVPTLPVQTGATMQAIRMDGVIQAVTQSTIAAQVAGNIVARPVKAGDAVKAGQVLARIDGRDTQAAWDVRQAEVVQAQAQLANAKMQWERSQSLRAQGFISEAALDQARAQWAAAQAAVAATQAGSRQAALAKGFAQVVAPFDGLVLATHADVGELAAPGRPLLTLYSPKALRAVVQVPASQAQALRQTQHVEVQSADGWIKPIRIAALPATDPISQTVEWRLDLPESATGWMPGQTVQVRWNDAQTLAPAAKGPATVPASALLKRGELTAVYVVREGRFVLQSVRAGQANSQGQVPVWAGLQSGDRIAADAVRAGLADATPQAR